MALIRGLATHLTLDRKLILASTAHLSILRPKVPGWISHDSCWWCSCSHINLIVYINVYNIRLIYSIYIFFRHMMYIYIYIYYIIYTLYIVSFSLWIGGFRFLEPRCGGFRGKVPGSWRRLRLWFEAWNAQESANSLVLGFFCFFCISHRIHVCYIW